MDTNREEPPPDSKFPPGSELAVANGCTCPIVDNNRGERAPFPPSGWWIQVGCPLHDPSGENS